MYLHYSRLRIQANWRQFIKSTNSFGVLPGAPVAREEFCRIAFVVALAVANPCKWYICNIMDDDCWFFVADKTEWDVTRFAERVKNTRPCIDGDNFAEDARLAKFFVNPNFGDVDEPCTMLDRHGRIMVWYLPHIFVSGRVVSTTIILF